MARPNPDWPASAAPAAPAPPGAAVRAGGEPAPAVGPVRLLLEGAGGQVVLSLLVTGDLPGECMPEALALILRLHGEGGGEISLTRTLARTLRGLLIRTAVPPEVEDDVGALITALQLQMMSTTHG